MGRRGKWKLVQKIFSEEKKTWDSITEITKEKYDYKMREGRILGERERLKTDI